MNQGVKKLAPSTFYLKMVDDCAQLLPFSSRFLLFTQQIDPYLPPFINLRALCRRARPPSLRSAMVPNFLALGLSSLLYNVLFRISKFEHLIWARLSQLAYKSWCDAQTSFYPDPTLHVRVPRAFTRSSTTPKKGTPRPLSKNSTARKCAAEPSTWLTQSSPTNLTQLRTPALPPLRKSNKNVIGILMI